MNETLEQQIQVLEKHIAAEPQSPLFARLAGCYLEAGRSQEALSVCDIGLAHHPFYTTGHLLKGKVLLALNMRSEARREFEFVHELLPHNEAVERLLASVPPSPDESLVAPAEQQESPPPEAAAELRTPVEETFVQEPLSPEASADQLLSQFTEEQAPAPAAAEERTPQESTIFEQPVVEAQPPEQSFVEQAPPGQSEDVFGISTTESIPAGQEQPEPAAEQIEEQIPPQPSESFEEFSDRKRVELFGLENSMSFEEYLEERSNGAPTQPVAESPSAETPPAEDPFAALTQYEEQQSPATPLVTAEETVEDPFAQLHQTVEEQPEETKTSVEARAEEPKDHIEELAEKLKDAKKITPVINLSDHTITPSSEADTPSGTGFVTPTLAEIYAKQGWYEDAIKAYKTLAATKPAEREKYESRIRELEEEKKKQEGG